MDLFNLKFETEFGSLKWAEINQQHHRWRKNFRCSKRPMKENALMEFIMMKYFTYLF